MDRNQIVEQAEFGLSLARLARAISDQSAPEIEETEQALRLIKPPVKRDVM